MNAASERREASHANGSGDERRERAPRSEVDRAMNAASERREASHANGARRRSGARESVLGSLRGEAPQLETKRRARERVGESEGRSPSVRKRSGARESVSGSLRGEAPQLVKTALALPR